MPEPLSIITGVLTLIHVTGTVSNELWKLREGAAVIHGTIKDLQNDVTSFRRVLESMRDVFERITAESTTGHIGSLWKGVAQSLVDAQDNLQHLKDLVTEFNRETKFLDEYRKQLRLNRTEEKLARNRVHIQSCRDTLQLSLQTIILVNQYSYQTLAEHQVVPSLTELQEDVHRIARRLNEVMKTSQPTEAPNEEIPNAQGVEQSRIQTLLECKPF